MARHVRIATCQPPAPHGACRAHDVERRAIELLEQAAQDGADICCLPECLNVMGCTPEEARARAGDADGLIGRVGDVCRRYEMYAILPVIDRRVDRFYNTALIVDRGGGVAGRYDKVHLTRDERENWALTPGAEYPVFDLDFGVIGIMICYDGCFPEPARILALEGAGVVFFPSLQRSFTEDQLALQVRSRAADSFLYVVRSSYGTERTDVWRLGTMVGKSCIAAPDGIIVADLSKHVGVTSADVDLDLPLLGLRSHAGEAGVAKDMRFLDRRPETYGRLTESGVQNGTGQG